MNFFEVKNYTLNIRHDSFLLFNFTHLMDSSVIDVSKLFTAFNYCPWVFSIIGSILVGLSGVVPLWLIPIGYGENLKSGAGSKRLKVLLSFAVGGLLGDVFLHLLPEAWEYQLKSDVNKDNHPSFFCGLWVLVGMLVFVIVEKLFSNQEERPEKPKKEGPYSKSNGVQNRSKKMNPVLLSRIKDKVPNYILTSSTITATTTTTTNNNIIANNNNNNNNSKFSKEARNMTKEHHHISGYLNLMANSIDNFTHGLAIGGSFCISFKIGVLSTFAILVHEIPHEIGDFAILLKSGFSRRDAAKAQIYTATSGILGAMFAVGFGSSDSMNVKTSWILPFTAGGFLHIALVTVLPDLIREKSGLESFKQLASLIFGIVVMAVLIIIIE